MYKTYLMDFLTKGTYLEANCQVHMLIEELCNGIFSLAVKISIQQNWNRKGAKYWWMRMLPIELFYSIPFYSIPLYYSIPF